MTPTVTADWPTLAKQARVALRYWDAYCPDDGRPLWALDIAEAYWRGLADDAQLTQAQIVISNALRPLLESRRALTDPAAGQAYRVGWLLHYVVEIPRLAIVDHAYYAEQASKILTALQRDA
jgi:hypothetical protein